MAMSGYTASNKIYHNNFLENTKQVANSGINIWDNGYSSGGNYWSDYTGNDNCSGPYQNETGSDNIGDSPYVIDPSNIDNFPLMKPYVPFENQTIYLRSDGSVDPSGVPIQRSGDVYTLTDNITSNADGMVVERDNIVVDGAGYTLRGSGTGTAVYLSGRENVTTQNIQIAAFSYGIFLELSNDSSISGNNIENESWDGIMITSSFHNNVSGNTLRGNGHDMYSHGVYVWSSSNNIFSGNEITNNSESLWIVEYSNYNSVWGNDITNNSGGIFVYTSYGNSFYHNNFINNSWQVSVGGSWPFNNVWDDGYPSGGNYWSD
jgi:parallel beta-helix repeat protein